MESFATLVSLGCAKNLVDSETMVPQLRGLGYTMTSHPEKAELILVNTCGFLESAVEEAIETILELALYKTTGSCKYLIVAGCMVQRYGKKLGESLPEVDFFLGTSHYHKLAEALQVYQEDPSNRLWIGPPRHLITAHTPRVRSAPLHSTYIKIAEGCNNRCTYCMIPHLRGSHRSRTVEDVLEEASRLVEEGVIEINLIAQDITAFGSDRDDPVALIRLLEALEQLQGLVWVRLLYAYPDRITESLLLTIAQSEKIVPYLDIPFQHCVPGILSVMRRRGVAPNVEKVVDLIRSHIPDIALRTSLMVGFPGETEADFRTLLNFVERIRFDHIGVFAFSPETGSLAARLPGQIEEGIKEHRRRLLMEVQREISGKRLKHWIGKTVPVLIEGFHPETELLITGRMPTQAPEVDGIVMITRGDGCPGQIMPVTITASHDYDLEGEIVAYERENPSGC